MGCGVIFSEHMSISAAFPSLWQLRALGGLELKAERCLGWGGRLGINAEQRRAARQSGKAAPAAAAILTGGVGRPDILAGGHQRGHGEEDRRRHVVGFFSKQQHGN